MLTDSTKVEPVYKSSSNLMLITFWSKSLSGTGKRGFKFTYDSDEPQGKFFSIKKNFKGTTTTTILFFFQLAVEFSRTKKVLYHLRKISRVFFANGNFKGKNLIIEPSHFTLTMHESVTEPEVVLLNTVQF